ncbi:hypothetical protein MHB42_16665 [Lysinibacillus sp. FSL K6-0232]|uniref:hypothetical protein n=1 Tax=unclassified Lysinibacillus TaxID=2636778 RepID=UPI0030F4EFEB
MQYRRLGDIMLASNIAIYFSILMLAIASLTDVPTIFIFIGIGCVLLSFILDMIFLELAKVV